MLVNNRGWIFPEVHQQYTIGLICVKHGQTEEKSIFLRGPYSAAENKYIEDRSNKPAAFFKQDALNWNESASLPLCCQQISRLMYLHRLERRRVLI